MSLVDDIKKNLANPNLTSTQKANLQTQLNSAQGVKPVPTVPKPAVTPTPSVNPAIPKAATPSAVSSPQQSTTPSATSPAPTSTPQPTTSPQPSQPSSIAGFDESSLLKGGISQDQIDKMKNILSPTLQAEQNAATRATAENQFIQQDLTDEQKKTEALYADVKKRKEDLTQQALAINDETAQVQSDRAAQEYQQNKFTNEQAQKQYELDQSRNEADLQSKNEENEIGFRRAIGAQLGAAFSSEGIYRYVKVKQDGSQMLSDLRSQTAIGKAEFSFKAMDIEKNYTTSLKEISNNRQSQATALLSNLNDQLDEIDGKILSSSEEKRQAARDAMKEYYDKLNSIDENSATAVTSAVNNLYVEKKQLEQEKLEKETFDVNMSANLGFYANKYGQPIGVRDGETPKPYAGDVDEFMSKQIGFLVDKAGHKVLGTDGKAIAYKDLAAMEQQQLMDGLFNSVPGSFSELNQSKLGSALGENTAISNKFPKWYKGGQCGTFIRTQFTNDTFSYGMTVADKKAIIAKHGIQYKDWNGQAQVGDVIMQNYGTAGHVAIINKIERDPKTGHMIATLTESNYYSKSHPERVTNTRTIDITADGGSSIIGAMRGNLKPEYKLANPVLAPPQFDNGNSEANNYLDTYIGTPEAFKQMAQKAFMGDKDAANAIKILNQKFGAAAIQKWAQAKSTTSAYDINQFKNNSSAYLSLPDAERKRYQEIYSDEEIKQVLGGKTIEQIRSPEPTDLTDIAKSIANYQFDISNISSRIGKDLTTSERQKIMSEVLKINPNYKEGNFDTKNNFIKSWSGTPTAGNYAFQNNSANTAIQHLGEMYKLYDKLNNAGVKNANEFQNYIKEHTGDADVQAYLSGKDIVAMEIARAISGGQPTESEVKTQAETLSENLAPDQMLNAIKTKANLLGGRIKTNVNAYKRTIGVLPDQSVLDPENQQTLKGLGLNPEDIDPTLKGESSNTSTQTEAPSLFNFFGLTSEKNNNSTAKTTSTSNGSGYESLLNGGGNALNNISSDRY